MIRSTNIVTDSNAKIMLENQNLIMKNEKSVTKEEEEYEYTKKFTFEDSGYLHAQGIFYIKYVNDDEGKTHTISGTELVRKFQQEKLKIPPSLNYFVELVRKQDNPTEEELKVLEERELKRKQVEKEREELKNLINKTKASSRLERLKAQNSITK